MTRRLDARRRRRRAAEVEHRQEWVPDREAILAIIMSLYPNSSSDAWRRWLARARISDLLSLYEHVAQVQGRNR